MKIFNIVCVIGTRPEALKMIPVIESLQKINRFSVKTVITSQHRELLSQILKSADIKIDTDFDVMAPNQSLNQLSANLFLHFDQFLAKNPCDLLIAQGDTTTTLISALSAFYKKIPFAHIEAGLRTSTIYNPFPEELNRRIITLISRLHFCPTQLTANNLTNSGITQHVYVTGNTIIDTLCQSIKKIKTQTKNNKKVILVTCHRRENFGKPLFSICQALKKIVERNPSIEIVLPIHPNPSVKMIILKELTNIKNIILCEALEYVQLITQLKNCYFVLTDSGGLQEEAPALHKPVLVLREETERPEGLACGAALLVGTDINTIVSQAEKLLYDKNHYRKMSEAGSPYGDGKAAMRITKIITAFLTNPAENKEL
ncbi:MAG: UDP-N-acetylglucosamine 2-epimerase (non-hydrolyzing) [Candidatus Aquirickettsiella sp.]